jgi:hypothetical protein
MVRKLFVNITNPIFRYNLNTLAQLCGTDKYGSHINQDVIASFKFLFPRLNPGGIYVIEDTETSYVDSYGGDSEDLYNPKTTINFFKSLIDYMHSENINNNILPDSLCADNIKSMHFYDNIIFITKAS